MKSAPLLALAACIILASCATMKNADTRPTEGSCMASYDSGRIGEKEVLAGNILLPVGLAFMVIGLPTMLVSVGPAYSGEEHFIPGTVFTAIGGMAIIAGIVTLVDGHRRVDKWNDYCTGATAAERYCLFEPLGEQRQ